ncbi:hypothetical protein STA3757_30370 [Stanieria sp. NIES-3757]|nr:hypothetical protein STA3757_30370 [Stanieria sp. NIES-3757]
MSIKSLEEVSKYTFYIFKQNFLDFEKAVDAYTEEIYKQDVEAFDLAVRQHQTEKFELFKKETARLLHNYLSAWFSLREQTYAAEKSLTDTSLLSEIKLKKGEMFKDNAENSFIQGLRNYIQHRSLPLIELHSSIGFEFEQPDFEIEHSLYLDTIELLKWDSWQAAAKNYLVNHPEKILIKEIIKRNFSYIEEFNLWLIKLIESNKD